MQDLKEQNKLYINSLHNSSADLDTSKKEKKLRKLKELDEYTFTSNNQEIRQQQQQLYDLYRVRRSDRHIKEKYQNLNEKVPAASGHTRTPAQFFQAEVPPNPSLPAAKVHSSP